MKQLLGLKKQTNILKKLRRLCVQLPSWPHLTLQKTFIVECDASGHGIGVVLMRKEGPLPLKVSKLKENTYSNPFMKKKCWSYYM
jgi:hypothetical protein